MSLITEHIQPMLDRKFPAALVAAFLLQTAGALFWAGSAAERITVLERTVSEDQSAIARVAVLEEQVSEMKTSLDRIDQARPGDAKSECRVANGVSPVPRLRLSWPVEVRATQVTSGDIVKSYLVMAGLVPAIHTLRLAVRSWVAGTSPAMTPFLIRENNNPNWVARTPAGHDSERN